MMSREVSESISPLWSALVVLADEVSVLTWIAHISPSTLRHFFSVFVLEALDYNTNKLIRWCVVNQSQLLNRLIV